MTKIQKLAYGLIGIIIKYHDSQNVEERVIDAFAKKNHLERKAAEEKIISDTFALKQDQLKGFLTNLIEGCTANYQERKDYLNYILNTALFIHECCSRTNAFGLEELNRIELQLNQLFHDFRLLLTTTKGTPCQVHNLSTCSLSKDYQDIKNLTGLLDYVGYYYTRSGNFLNTEVMQVFKIGKNTHEEDIAATAKLMCLELQTPHLIKLIEQQKKELKELREEKEFAESRIRNQMNICEKLKQEKEDNYKQLLVFSNQLTQKTIEYNALKKQLDESLETNKKMKEKFTTTFALHTSKMDYNSLLKQFGFNSNRDTTNIRSQQAPDLNNIK